MKKKKLADRLTEKQLIILRQLKDNLHNPYPTSCETLQKLTGLTKRGVEDAILSMKLRADIPIVATKLDTLHGYYLPLDESQRQLGLRAYKKQIYTSTMIVDKVESINLEEFYSELKEV